MKYIRCVDEVPAVLKNQIQVGTWVYETRRDFHSIIIQNMKIRLSVLHRTGGKFSSEVTMIIHPVSF
jgi:hypothetical protein